MSGLIWGSLFVLIGLSIMFHLPFFRIAVGLLLIYWGISFMFGGHWAKARFHESLFTQRTPTADQLEREYNTVFGKSVIDLTTLDPEKTQPLELNTVFGFTSLIVDPKIPLKIQVNAAFSGVTLPDGTVLAFGKYSYKTPGWTPTANAVNIEANVVFGGLEIK